METFINGYLFAIPLCMTFGSGSSSGLLWLRARLVRQTAATKKLYVEEKCLLLLLLAEEGRESDCSVG
jgi:hypothetical protein